jgi:HNH endonuclease
MDCALCDQTITQSNNSNEHIIQNALGGMLKVSDVLCIACNSRTGSEWDSVLASQLNPMSLLCHVKRESGRTPTQSFTTSAGEEFRLAHDGDLSTINPIFEKKELEGGKLQIKIVARTMPEAKAMLEGLRRKYPSIDTDSALAQAEQRRAFPQGIFNFPLAIGGPESGRSLVKSALCLAVANGVKAKSCTGAQEYLRNPNAAPSFGYYYERDLLLNRPTGVPLQCVAVSNRNREGQLLGYVEFFGIWRAVVCLSSSYDGPDIHVAYAVDPVEGKELQIEFSLDLTRADIKAIYAYERIPDGAILEAGNSVMSGIHKRNFERNRDKAIRDAVMDGFKQCGAKEGEELTPEQQLALSRVVAERLASFLIHLRQRDGQPPPAAEPQASEPPSNT